MDGNESLSSWIEIINECNSTGLNMWANALREALKENSDTDNIINNIEEQDSKKFLEILLDTAEEAYRNDKNKANLYGEIFKAGTQEAAINVIKNFVSTSQELKDKGVVPEATEVVVDDAEKQLVSIKCDFKDNVGNINTAFITNSDENSESQTPFNVKNIFCNCLDFKPIDTISKFELFIFDVRDFLCEAGSYTYDATLSKFASIVPAKELIKNAKEKLGR